VDNSAIVDGLLGRLAPDQRAAATAPSGPILCIAPAGSGKTTTLVARVAWLLVTVGVAPDAVTAITFNKRAADELAGRLATALRPLGTPPGAIRVRTFHALGLEILRSAGVEVRLAERDALLRTIRPDASPADRRRLDDAISRLKLDLGISATDVTTDPEPGPVARAFLDYQGALVESGRLDFDDLVVRALAALGDPALLATWRGRCTELLVDEVQDVDRTQLDLALRLAAPANRVFLVGDDDQSIYGWRLADVRRVIGLAERLPGLRRMDLVTNYRCPTPVVERAVRLVEGNTERFAKRIVAGPVATGRLILAPDQDEDVDRWTRVLRSWPDDGSTRAILTRTNRELVAAVAAAIALGVPFRSAGLALPIESPWVDRLLAATERPPRDRSHLIALASAEAEVLATLTDDEEAADEPSAAQATRAVLGWASAYPSVDALAGAIQSTRDRLRALRQDDAVLTLATAHGTKGLEFDHVAVLMDEARFPSARAVAEATDPARMLEEERRLAYVAWTRARASLTLLYDPAAPSRFLLEAFDPEELGLDTPAAA
jgi:superfamily I DNA/RNA helicase